MRFLNVRAQRFRNIEFAELGLAGDRNFLLGANGQGKSNLLEALGLVTALRSFRTQNAAALPMKGGNDYALFFEIEHERMGRTEVELRSRGGRRTVLLDGETVGKLADFIGRFPAVPLHSGDLMLLRGSPADRRRFLDLTLAATDAHYYTSLRDYHRGVLERNRLLKGGGGGAELTAFEAHIAPQAVKLTASRKAGIERLRAVTRSVYATMAEAEEGPELRFRPSDPCDDEEQVRRFLHEGRERDAILGSTQKGPHRDDFEFRLGVGGAREYASDGQQRGLCVALRIAQAIYFEERLGLRPVLLADDVLGELDPRRKAGFWTACPKGLQIIATGTELPAEAQSWAIWRVATGAFSLGRGEC